MTVDQQPSTKQNARRRALQAAARLTTGVTLLTVAHEDTVHGATVSAASLVSRSPLIVAAGLRTGSTLTRLATESGQFAVNVLSQRQSLVADWFANPARPAGHKQFALIDWEPHPSTGLPLLRGAVSVLVCRVHSHIGAGDHELLLGEVVEGTVGVGSPLLSFAGALHSAELRDVIRGRGGASPCTTTLD